MAAKHPPKGPKNPDKGQGFQPSVDVQGQKKTAPPIKRSIKPSQTSAKPSDSKSSDAAKSKVRLKVAQRSQGIPEQVSKRMVRRMAVFCGVPTALGLASFPAGYILLQQGIELPNVAVLLVSLGFLGLGVLGLSYGALSASWDEGVLGTRLGWPEFRLNLGRTLESWKDARERNQS